MSYVLFVRHYWGHPCWFLFLRLLICLNSAGVPAWFEVEKIGAVRPVAVEASVRNRPVAKTRTPKGVFLQRSAPDRRRDSGQPRPDALWVDVRSAIRTGFPGGNEVTSGEVPLGDRAGPGFPEESIGDRRSNKPSPTEAGAQCAFKISRFHAVRNSTELSHFATFFLERRT